MFGSLKRSPGRLGAWHGRRGPRGDRPSLAAAARHPILPRLAAAAVTAALAAAIAFAAGPPVAYRVGETPARDLRVRVRFDVLNLPQTDWAREEFGRPGVGPVVEKYPAGLPLVKRGQPISEGQYQLLREEQRAYLTSLDTSDLVSRAAALTLISLLLTFVLVLYVARFQAALAGSLTRVLCICGLALVTIGVGLLLSRGPWHALLLPLTVTALVLT